MAAGHKTSMLFPKLISNLAEFAYTGEGFLSIFFNMDVNLDNHAKVQKSFFLILMICCSTFLLLIYS